MPVRSISRFLSVLILLLISLGCQKEADPLGITDPLAPFIGQWDNINSQSTDFTRVIITVDEINQVSVQFWESCMPDDCDPVELHTLKSDAEDGFLELSQDRNGQAIIQKISIGNYGKLQLEEYPEDQPEALKINYFSKIQTVTLYHQVKRTDVQTVSLSRMQINGTNGDPGNRLKAGAVLAYQTSEGHYGKLQIRGNSTILTFRWATWNQDGTFYRHADYLATKDGRFYDLDLGEEKHSNQDGSADFWLADEPDGERWLVPLNTAGFEVYHLEE